MKKLFGSGESGHSWARLLATGTKPAIHPLSQMFRSLLSHFTPYEDTELFCVLEYNGITSGWTNQATRKGIGRAVLLKDRMQMVRPNKLFKIGRA